MKLIVFTVMLGETIPLLPPDLKRTRAHETTVRYLCFSDRPCIVEPYEWIPLPESDRPQFDSRRIKVLADHPVLQSADVTLWHDASYRLLRSPLWAVKVLLSHDLAGLRNKSRVVIDDEAMRIAHYGYVSPIMAMAHVARYRAEGFTETDGLTAGGLLARRSSRIMSIFNRIWWAEVQRWGGRDQGSLDYAAWKAGLRVRHLLGTIKANEYADWRQTKALAAQAEEAVSA